MPLIKYLKPVPLFWQPQTLNKTTQIIMIFLQSNSTKCEIFASNFSLIVETCVPLDLAHLKP